MLAKIGLPELVIKSPSDLTDFIEMNKSFKKELQKFEGEIEWDEI